MSDALAAGELPLPERPDYLRAGRTLASWLTTTDHKAAYDFYQTLFVVAFAVAFVVAAILGDD